MPKSNFLSMLTASNATSPFSLSTKKKAPVPTPAPQSKPVANQSTSTGSRYVAPPVAPATPPTTSAARNTFVQSQMGTPQMTDAYSRIKNSANKINDLVSGASDASITTPKADPMDKYRSAMDAYIESLSPSSRLGRLQEKYDNLSESIRSGISRQEDEAIPLQFIAGRQREIERRGNELLMPLEAELRRTMSDEQARSEALKVRAEFERTLLEDEREANQRDPFELSEGQSRYEYNPETGQYEETASKAKTYAPKAGGAGGIGALTGIAAEVMKNPALFSTLTPTVKGQVLSQLAGSGFDTAALTIPNLNSGQRESISEFDTLLREASNLTERMNTGINTGPIMSRIKGVGSALGIAPGYTDLKSVIDNMSSVLLRLRSGAAVTPTEYDRIKGFIPRPTDDENTIETKVNRFIEETRMARENYIENATLTPYQISKGGGLTAQGGGYEDYLKAIGQQ